MTSQPVGSTPEVWATRVLEPCIEPKTVCTEEASTPVGISDGPFDHWELELREIKQGPAFAPLASASTTSSSACTTSSSTEA